MAQGGVELGRGQERRESPELQNGGLRMEDAQIGGLRILAKLRMAGFWMHQVIGNIYSRPSEGGRVVPGQSCKEEGFVDFLSAPNQAQMTVTWVMLTMIWVYVHGFSVRFRAFRKKN